MTRKFQDLVGKTIARIDLSEAEDTLRFALSDGSDLYYYCQGDCCSTSYFGYFRDLAKIIGKPIISVQECNTVPGPPTRQEDDDVDYINLITDECSAQLAHINSSNGYYGGWVNRIEDPDREAYGGKKVWNLIS